MVTRCAYEPKVDADSANFVLLNRGKRSIAIDLKSPDALDQLTPLIRDADVLIEQYSASLMEHLGLGYAALAEINPWLVYCSITGFGQHGPRAAEAAHDVGVRRGILGNPRLSCSGFHLCDQSGFGWVRRGCHTRVHAEFSTAGGLLQSHPGL